MVSYGGPLAFPGTKKGSRESLISVSLATDGPNMFQNHFLREAKPGGFQTRVFPTFFGNGPDCVADPFGTVPRRCS